MNQYTIDKVKTGKGLAGSRVAVVFAPPEASPGSLVALTRFINAQPHLRAVPGYHGPNKNHVLRVSGLKSDEAFLKLLQEEFPAWAEEHESEAQIGLVPNIKPEPLNEVDHFPHKSLMQRFVKENANVLSGLAYMVGNMGLLYAAWRKPSEAGGAAELNHDWFRTYSALAYNVGSVVLIALGHQADNPRDVYSIMEDVYPPLQKADSAQRAEVHSNIDKAMTFLKNHPWEVSSAIMATGAASHVSSAVLRAKKGQKTTYEALSAFGTLTALSIAALVPEKEGRDIADLSGVFDGPNRPNMLQSAETMAQMEPQKGETAKRGNRFMDWLHESPLAVSAGIQSISNIGYGLSALKQKPIDPGLLTMSAAYLTGNYTQTQATKGRGPGFDDVVTAAAAIIQSDPKLQDKSPEEINARITAFVDTLADQHEIVHKRKRMAQGIRERLERYKLPREEENAILTGFLNDEKRVLKESPFVQPRYVDQVLNESSEEGVLTR